MIIDGKTIAAQILERLKAEAEAGATSDATSASPKFFGAALVGEDPASINFLKQKEKVAQELGIEFRLYKLPADITTDALRAEVGRLATPKSCGGFIVQLPLPAAINRHYVLNAIPKEKDVDCLGEAALGAFYTGRGAVVPPSVATLEEILNSELMRGAASVGRGARTLRDLKVVMVGAGFLIGKPIGFWLQDKVAELVVLDASVKDIHPKLSDADIVVSGAGHANLFSVGDLKTGAIVIDFGFNRAAPGNATSAVGNRTIVGDFHPVGAETKNIDYTKTPGGTGPILVAKLFENFYKLNAVRAEGIEPPTLSV